MWDRRMRGAICLIRLRHSWPSFLSRSGSDRRYGGAGRCMLDKLESRLASPVYGYGFTDCGLRYIRPPIGAVTRNQLAPFFDGGIMFRCITCLVFLISAHATAAQDQPPSPVTPPFFGGGAIPPTDLPSGIGNYCIYQSLIFSIGSPICVGKTSFVCAPSTEKIGFNQRGYWTARPNDPNLLSTPVCE